MGTTNWEFLIKLLDLVNGKGTQNDAIGTATQKEHHDSGMPAGLNIKNI